MYLFSLFLKSEVNLLLNVINISLLYLVGFFFHMCAKEYVWVKLIFAVLQ